MKNYILHIGLPKTGTTTLQRYYFSNLRRSSISYNPRSIIDPLVEALKLLDFGALTHEDMKFLDNVVKYQSKKIAQKNILISLEILSQRLMKLDFAERGRFLKVIFPNATIVLVLRYQPVLLRSLYQQHVYQNYLLMPEEVFVPFSKHLFPKPERWKESMRIDVKEWDYTELIKCFRYYYGARFHVLFFENYSINMLAMGKKILELSGFNVDIELAGTLNAITNVSYDADIMRLILAMANSKWVFHSNCGYGSRHMHNLMEEANQARYIFGANSVEDFLTKLENQQHISRGTYSMIDKQLLGIIKIYSTLRVKLGALCNRLRPPKYLLPEYIGTYLENESKKLNSSLGKVIDKSLIPKQYL